jgi:hypothetical protein
LPGLPIENPIESLRTARLIRCRWRAFGVIHINLT